MQALHTASKSQGSEAFVILIHMKQACIRWERIYKALVVVCPQAVITLPRDILQHIFKLQMKMDMKATNTYLFPIVRPHLLFSLVSLDVKISLLAPFTTFLFSYKTTTILFIKTFLWSLLLKVNYCHKLTTQAKTLKEPVGPQDPWGNIKKYKT